MKVTGNFAASIAIVATLIRIPHMAVPLALPCIRLPLPLPFPWWGPAGGSSPDRRRRCSRPKVLNLWAAWKLFLARAQRCWGPLRSCSLRSCSDTRLAEAEGEDEGCLATAACTKYH